MSKIILSGYIEVSEVDREAVMAELPNHIQLTRAEPGCIVFEVIQDNRDPARFNVYEEFSDQAAFDKHQARVHASYWGQVAANVGRHYKIQRI